MSFVFQQMIADKGEAYEVSTDLDTTPLGGLTLCDGVFTVWESDWGKDTPAVFKRVFPVGKRDYGIEAEEIEYMDAHHGMSINADNAFTDDETREVYLNIAERVIADII